MKFYSRKTGKMHSGLDKKDRMSTAELAAYLSIKSLTPTSTQCPLCKLEKAIEYKFCARCHNKGKHFKREKSLERGRERHLKLKREAAKLPAKSRAKAEIVKRILAEQAAEEQKAKTLRYESLEFKLLLKKLEDFDS